MEIAKQEVEKVAKLARLAMTETETAAYSQQLNQIVAYVQKLKTFPTEGVEPTSTVLGQTNVFRSRSKVRSSSRRFLTSTRRDMPQGK